MLRNWLAAIARRTANNRQTDSPAPSSEVVGKLGESRPVFTQLNSGWNANPNVPQERLEILGQDVVLSFDLNWYRFSGFRMGERGLLRFENVSRFLLSEVNDDGWYRGQCRYSRLAPKWGEFYEISGTDPLRDQPAGWEIVGNGGPRSRHFLFYLRDSTFECLAEDWGFAQIAGNALLRL